MRLKQGIFGVLLAMTAPVVMAASPDPVYGDDVQANAVLDCQADYARRYAKAMTAQRATATEVAIAAGAQCAAEFEAFLRSRVQAADEAGRVRAMLSPDEFVEYHRQQMREYAHAHTLQVYLSSTATF